MKTSLAQKSAGGSFLEFTALQQRQVRPFMRRPLELIVFLLPDGNQ